jgi:2-phospho-L-lactate guanylyltransferase
MTWTIVIPVKGTATAKSRLGGTPELALAIALDTVESALAVAPVLVVTAADSAAFRELGARVILDEGDSLLAAISLGLAEAGSSHVAVLLGDVAALQPVELEAALQAAERHPLAFVPDADGDGTVLITAINAADHAPAFGAHSRAAHLAAGYIELDVPIDSGLRRDIDTRVQLEELRPRLGPRTRVAEVSSNLSR